MGIRKGSYAKKDLRTKNWTFKLNCNEKITSSTIGLRKYRIAWIVRSL